jgi:hypothetical protein
MTAGRQRMYVAGTSASAKHAIAQTRPSTIRKDVRPAGPPELLLAGLDMGSETWTMLWGRGVGANVLCEGAAGFFFVRCAFGRAFRFVAACFRFGAVAFRFGRIDGLRCALAGGRTKCLSSTTA